MTPKGTHWIIDLINLPQKPCIDGQSWVRVFREAAEAVNARVISTAYNDFKPPAAPGTTAFVLLDSSHFSVHTYARHHAAALDLFTCSRDDLTKAVTIIKERLEIGDENIIKVTKLDRFGSGEV